jgi:hypothetical protein
MDDVRASLKLVLAILLCVNVTAAVSVSTEAGVNSWSLKFQLYNLLKEKV